MLKLLRELGMARKTDTRPTRYFLKVIFDGSEQRKPDKTLQSDHDIKTVETDIFKPIDKVFSGTLEPFSEFVSTFYLI